MKKTTSKSLSENLQVALTTVGFLFLGTSVSFLTWFTTN